MDSLLPANATTFERDVEAVTRPDFSSPIGQLWNPHLCPPELLYVLALTLQVDIWDENWSTTAKAETLLGAFLVHAHRGTPSAIRRVLANAGYEDIKIAEGLGSASYDGAIRYDGHHYYGDPDAWYKYRIYLNKAITSEQAKQVRALIDYAAPLHTELMGLHYDTAQFTYNAEIMFNGLYNYGAA
ncbi:phage tail protein I, partial [Photobacterium leiognathi]|uniref:phage tail protein I n=1 Tax=Photobacterium leiognathi TaxID=553611 RepID=UPI0027399443